jgi:hypothetical protein
MFKLVSKTICTLTVVQIPVTSSPTPSTSSAVYSYEDFRKQQDPDGPEPADEEDTQMENLSE